MPIVDHRVDTDPHCPHCDALLSGALTTDPDRPGGPTPGALSICIYCLGWCAFDDRLRLRPLTADEAAWVAEDEEAQRVMGWATLAKAGGAGGHASPG